MDVTATTVSFGREAEFSVQVNIEFVKWAGFVCMIVDHVGYYYFGVLHPVSEAFGALALPLFAVALGVGLAGAGEQKLLLVMNRMLVFFLLAQGAVMLLREAMPLNILGTLWSGTALYWCLISSASLSGRLPVAVAALLLGAFSEFTFVGAFLVFVSVGLFDRGSAWWFVSWCLALALLTPFNGSIWSVATVPVILLVGAFPSDLVRVRGVFYWLYVLQYPVLWVARRFLS